MRNGLWIVAAVACGLGGAASATDAASILVIGQNRNAIYQVDYTGDPTVPGSYNSTVSLYADLRPLITNAAELPFGIVRNNTTGDVFVTTAGGVNGAAPQSRIIKVDDATRTPSVLLTRNTGTTGFSNANANGIQIGPDGKLYFATAFGTGNTQGVFRVNQDGTGFEQFVAPSASTPPLTLAARDLAFAGGKLYLTHRTTTATVPDIFRYDGTTGAFEVALTETRNGASSITAAENGLLYIGHNTVNAGAVTSYDPTTGTFADVVTGTAPANSLGLQTINAQPFYLDFNAGTGTTGQLRRANATADVVFSFVGKNDPLSTTGGLLTGYLPSEFVNLPEPTTLGALAGVLTVIGRRRRA